jgi:hypothetical protein
MSAIDHLPEPPASEPTPARTVPDELRGVWQRTLLQTGTDAAAQAGAAPASDTQSWVRWLQTSAWHGDLRLPEQALAARQPLPLTQLSAGQLGALACQQGFAGITQFEALPEGQICTWLRRIDYQPPGLQPDAGWMLFEQPDRLIEIGVHEDYNEIWQRLPDSVGRFVTLASPDDAAAALPGPAGTAEPSGPVRLLLAGQYLMLVRGRLQRWPRGMTPGCSLADVMLRHPEQALQWLDCEISFGRLLGGEWLIERSTLPEREGLRQPCALQRLDANRAWVTLGDTVSEWRVLEWSSTDERISD